MQEKNTPDLVGRSNGNKFANPLEYRGFEYYPHSATVTVWNHESGFTKREVIAKDIFCEIIRFHFPKDIAEQKMSAIMAVDFANILLAELAKPQGE